MDGEHVEQPSNPAPGPAAVEPNAPAGRIPRCPSCVVVMRFADGMATHDLYAERYVCPNCGRETYRSFGRGSVS
jgi:predicted RNA-binding Zn-ribbon protein involved in translation (DUF1610 family)